MRKRIALLLATGLTTALTSAVVGTGTAAATAVCPPGSQIDPQNSQQCRSLSPPGPETATAGCQSAGYSIDPHGSGYCVDSFGRDTLGRQQ